jgi:thymidine phosphorylase
MLFLPQELIRIKRDGGTLSTSQIHAFILGVTRATVSDAQIAAFAMAVFHQGMSRDEAVALTIAMRDSGTVLDWSSMRADLHGPLLDKHSTGGVGDTVSLLLGPLVAACGGCVPMISGRGLGHTGGTLDKLESIPGYNSRPDLSQLRRVVREAGVAIIGQTADLAPADRRIYAVRDVTATVESIPLITASILSKKLAAGLDALVMDVKTGNGAFMASTEQAQALARSIVEVGEGAGLRTTACLTDMNQPLANCAGNAIEVRHAIAVLKRTLRPVRLLEVTFALAEDMLISGRLAASRTEARRTLTAALDSGRAAECFSRMVHGLGGPADLLESADKSLALAPVTLDITAAETGYITQIDTRTLGLAVVGLGGGRSRAEDKIDPCVGLGSFAELGQRVTEGDLLARVHARTTSAASEVAIAVRAAFGIGPSVPPLPTLVQSLTATSP